MHWRSPSGHLQENQRQISQGREDCDKDGVLHVQKESTRWIDGYKCFAEMAVQLLLTRLVHVADREADLLTMML